MDLTRHEVAQKVTQYIDGRHPGGVTLEVIEDAIQKIDYWWRVPIRPSQWPQRMYEFYEVLAEIESELQEQENLNVLFSTGEPIEAQAA